MASNSSKVEDSAHGAERPTGHRAARRRWLIPAVLAALLLAVSGGFLVNHFALAGTGPGCIGGSTTITVAADADFPVLQELARRWTNDHPAVDGRCVAARVVLKSSHEVAAALGPGWDQGRDGARPDVWASDSTLWLRFAASRPEAASLLPNNATSIATSPVVLALRKPLAQAFGWPQRVLGFEEALGAFVKPDTWSRVGHPEWASLHFGTTEPTTSTAGLASVVTLLDRDGDGEFSDQELSASLPFSQVLGDVAPGTSVYYDQLRNAKPNVDPPIAAFPTVEQELATYAASTPAEQLVPIYPKQSAMVADYPYTILRAKWVDPVRRAAAEQFLQYVLSPVGREALGAKGFRDPARGLAAAAMLKPELGFRPDLPAVRDTPTASSISNLIADWTGLLRRLSILAVLDVSGSMNAPVPDTQLTRLQLLKQTAAAGFRLLPFRTSIGLWDFSSKLDGDTDYRELVPFGPLAQPVAGHTRVQALLGAIDGLTAGGGTGLYDTTYAAFQAMQSRWQPNTSNIVLLITDGKNEQDTGLDRAQLIDRLTKEARPDRPTQIISFAVGPEADADALQEISRVTGGRTFIARDPGAAVQMLTLAFAGRLR